MKVNRIGGAVFLVGMLALLLVAGNAQRATADSVTPQTHSVDNCLAYDSADGSYYEQMACTDPSASLQPPGTYIGHDEPDMQFYSTVAGSANSMTWTLNMPRADPTPNSAGTSVASYQLYPAFWFSMSLCDPNSFPFGACTPDSDLNTAASAGSALLELQFYPTDSPFNNLAFNPTSWPATQKWTAAMTIDSFNNFKNAACIEPVNVGQITTNGLPAGTNLGMNPGDNIQVVLSDTVNGLSAVVNDLTTGQSGSMVASIANLFTHSDPNTCVKSPFAFHPEYSTASSTHITAWTALAANINVAFEIGHVELNLPGSLGTGDGDADDSGCFPIFLTCYSQLSAGDSDYDGLSYQSVYADGNAAHPGTLVLLGGPTVSGSIYPNLQFKSEQIGGQNGNCLTTAPKCAFYPWFSTAGTSPGACVFNFGNDLPLGATGTNTATLNDYGKDAQYNTGTNVSNPCTPVVRGAPEFSIQGIMVLIAPMLAILLFMRKRATNLW